ncbi:MAG: N-acetylmuramic acid 6-phosphate etherase [Planctomycetes bacterium]|nr:N-acetylmuramic acid 6-phosphate etherase [Planctomycetota bacterium]
MTASWKTEEGLPESRWIDRAGTREVLAILHRADEVVHEAVGRALPAIERTVELAMAALSAGGRVVYVGAGTSGRLGALDAAEMPPTFGLDPSRVFATIAGGPAALSRAVEGAEDDREAGRRAMAEHGVSPADLVLGITASGRTPFVLAALEEAGTRGAARAILVANSAPPALPAETVIEVLVGAEAIAGSTRLKSGTATKIVLNLITTATMVRLGKVYENLMVDLAPTNEKLRGRARRILAEVCGATASEADRLLAAAAGPSPVKVAIAMKRLGLSAAEARRRLDEAGGFLHRLLG